MVKRFKNQDAAQIHQQLVRIADVLEALALVMIPAQETEPEPPAACPHPEESRIDFGMTNGRPDWECSLCHYRVM